MAVWRARQTFVIIADDVTSGDLLGEVVGFCVTGDRLGELVGSGRPKLCK